jgi:hypothetical protein
MGLSQKEIDALLELGAAHELLKTGTGGMWERMLAHQMFQSQCLLAIVQKLYEATEE